MLESPSHGVHCVKVVLVDKQAAWRRESQQYVPIFRSLHVPAKSSIDIVFCCHPSSVCCLRRAKNGTAKQLVLGATE